MPILLDLFLTFNRIGALTFGGGYAMLPMLQREIVNRGWTTEEELMDWYALGQCAPGLIAANVATFVGYKKRGSLGGIVATLGVVFPSLVVITIIAAILQNFAGLPAVKNAFAGIRVCVCVLILNAIVKLWKKAVVDVWSLVIYIIVLAGSVFTTLSPVLFVLFAAAAGLLVKVRAVKKK